MDEVTPKPKPTRLVVRLGKLSGLPALCFVDGEDVMHGNVTQPPLVATAFYAPAAGGMEFRFWSEPWPSLVSRTRPVGKTQFATIRLLDKLLAELKIHRPSAYSLIRRCPKDSTLSACMEKWKAHKA